jgi:hypothetical protein
MENATKAIRAVQYPVAQICKRAAVLAAVMGTTLTLIARRDAVFGALSHALSFRGTVRFAA